ncbi:helix-turn-helix domain-containing protein [Peterkaempfera griseoplana]|uniref:helix-turn-helix domain-containing protein n=1 Tax=Peterkaempfera griseoplana TaxID=66896 RepID=UPI0006E2C013|nr:helix-turn-helix transcriptional regulator [Peterkaempfera griseoplana]
MAVSPHVEQFAAYLRMLKNRSGHGFDRLGKQAGVSGSSLHRYCSGHSVPADYGVAHSFAKVCGASAVELRELHRLWALADTFRDTPPAPAAAAPAAAPLRPELRPQQRTEAVAVRITRYAGFAAAAAGALAVGGLLLRARRPAGPRRH